MRIPGVRFTVRGMMVAAATFAMFLVVAIPVANSLIWLYYAPDTIIGVRGSLSHRVLKLANPVPVNRPVPVHCSYECEIPPSPHPWLPYRVVVEVKLIEATGANLATDTAEETRRKTHLLVTGVDSWRKVRGEFNCTLTPRHPAGYLISYEVHAIDAFGGRDLIESRADWFDAQ